MRLPGDLGYLTYCLNIHPTQTWPEARKAIVGPMCSVKASLCPDAPFAAGLRFSAETVRALEQPEARAELKTILRENDLLAITVNGFPYGPFHGTPVKDRVYQPDWLSPTRINYTCKLADLMADLAPPDRFVSLSTVPGTFKPLADAADAAIADGLLQAAAHCAMLRERTGVTVAIAIEPEPFCFLETIAETVVFLSSTCFARPPFAASPS